MKVEHRHRARSVRGVAVVCCALAAVASAAFASVASADSNVVPGNSAFPSFEARSLDGTGNNVLHPNAGAAGANYIRIAPSAYADGVSSQRSGSTAPNARYISNRIFNDVGQNLFSERNMSQWAWDLGPVHRPHARPGQVGNRRRQHLDEQQRPAGDVPQRPWCHRDDT